MVVSSSSCRMEPSPNSTSTRPALGAQAIADVERQVRLDVLGCGVVLEHRTALDVRHVGRGRRFLGKCVRGGEGGREHTRQHEEREAGHERRLLAGLAGTFEYTTGLRSCTRGNLWGSAACVWTTRRSGMPTSRLSDLAAHARALTDEHSDFIV